MAEPMRFSTWTRWLTAIAACGLLGACQTTAGSGGAASPQDTAPLLGTTVPLVQPVTPDDQELLGLMANGGVGQSQILTSSGATATLESHYASAAGLTCRRATVRGAGSPQSRVACRRGGTWQLLRPIQGGNAPRLR